MNQTNQIQTWLRQRNITLEISFTNELQRLAEDYKKLAN